MKKDIEEYKVGSLKHLHAMRDKYRDLSSLEEAIKKAALAEDVNSKMNGHQRRIGYKKCEEGLIALKTKEIEFTQVKTFTDLMDITDVIAQSTKRLGALWSYDTSLRIGFYLDIHPKHVYVQSGVRKGVVKMFQDMKRIPRKMNPELFPKLKDLEPFEIENFLCVWGNGHLQKGC